MPDLIGALLSLAKALETQTTYLAQLTEGLATLTDNLVTLLDQIEVQNDDDDKYSTLS